MAATHDTKTVEIVGAIQRAAAALDGSGNQIGAALSHADHVRGRMMTAGFHGVAQRLTEVADYLKKVHSRLTGLSEQAKAATAPILEITDDLNVDQVIVKLSATGQVLTTAQHDITAVAAEIEQIERRIVAALTGGQPGPLVSILKDGRESTLQAAQHLDAAKQAVSEALAEAQQAGN